MSRTNEEVLTRRAPLPGASSWDAKKRTFLAVIAAGAGVTRYDWDGEYVERLDPGGIELATGIPFLNSHRAGTVSDIIGKVEKVERIGDRLEAVIRLSRRPDVDAIATDIQDGVLSAMSVGYSVSKWLEDVAEDGTRTKTATAWKLLEVSAVAVPADDHARIRSREQIMNENANIDVNAEPKVTRAATMIREIATNVGAAEFGERHATEGTSVEEFRTLLLEHLAEQQRKGPQIQSTGPAHIYADGFSNPATRAAAMGEALAARAMPDLVPSEAARQFVGLSLPELARENLRLAGEDVRGLTPAQAVTRSLGGLHSTSDFTVALSNAVGRVLRKNYEEAPSGLKPLARRLELADFRARTIVGLSGLSALEKVNEHGEFKRGTIKDGGESIRLETFGRMFGVTRQVLINDDLGWIADVPRKLAVAAAQFEARQLADLLASNPVMGDGKPLFHADHGNLAASGAALLEASLSAARLAMRKQKDEAGELIGVGPRFLVVGPELETSAEKLMATITPTDTGDVQPVKLTVVVEPRIEGKSWFVVASPGSVDGLAYAHLQSEPGPQLEYRVGFDVDGVEFKVRLDFGCSFLDWRSWYKNPGA